MSRAAELRRVIEANRIRLLTVKAWGTRLDFDCWEFTSSEPLTEAEWKRYLNPVENAKSALYALTFQRRWHGI